MRSMLAPLMLLLACGEPESLHQVEIAEPCADAGHSDAGRSDAEAPDAYLGPEWRPVGWQTRELLFGTCQKTAAAEVPCSIVGQQILLAEGAILIGLDEPVMQGEAADLESGGGSLVGRICRDAHPETVTVPVYECQP